MRLLLDLGNTRLKWALQASPGHWHAQGAVAWHDDVPAVLARDWGNLAAPAFVAAASVVSAEREALVTAVVLHQFGLSPAWLRTPAQACGVSNAYADPTRLGVDRFLAMLAAHAEGLGACVIAGLGTALTLDALTADGRHLGGLITPGPVLMQQSLLQATAQVRMDHPGEILELADNTTDAVVSGCWQAAVALVERFAIRMTPKLGGQPRLILGGGDAETLQRLLSQPSQLSHDSVLRGLAVWADAQPSSITAG